MARFKGVKDVGGTRGVTMTMTPESKRKLKALGRAEVTPELRKALKKATNAAVPAVRAQVRNMPSNRTGRRTKNSLRSQVAMAIKREIKSGQRDVHVAIMSVPHGGLANLARCVEGEILWRHPTFGHEPTRTQRPYPFFYHTLDAMIPGITIAVREVLIKFERRIP